MYFSQNNCLHFEPKNVAFVTDTVNVKLNEAQKLLLPPAMKYPRSLYFCLKFQRDDVVKVLRQIGGYCCFDENGIMNLI